MRIGEYLSARVSDVLPDDSVFIRAEKHSVSYSIFLPGINDQLKAFGKQPPTGSLSGSNYNRVYRACIRCGLGFVIAGHTNVVRTHASRHLRADEVRHIAGNLGAAAALHHRTLKAQMAYGAGRTV
jgi:integrase